MNKLDFAEICEIIGRLDAEETGCYNEHMRNNPADNNRTRDHLIINGTLCKVLNAIYKSIQISAE